MRADDLPPTADPRAGTPRSAAHADLVARADAVLPGGTTNCGPPPGRPPVHRRARRGCGAHSTSTAAAIVDFVLGGGPARARPRPSPPLASLRRAAALGGQPLRGPPAHRRAGRAHHRPACPRRSWCASPAAAREATFHALRLARAGPAARHRQVRRRLPRPPRPGQLVVRVAGPAEPRSRSRNRRASRPGSTRHRGAAVQRPRRGAGCWPRSRSASRPSSCEPVQRASPPPSSSCDAVRRPVTGAGTVLVFDEIVTGFRCAPGGYQER